jgi:hypothetical protein
MARGELGFDLRFADRGSSSTGLACHIGVRKADAELARMLEEVAKSLDGSPEMAAIRKRWGGRPRPALDGRAR